MAAHTNFVPHVTQPWLSDGDHAKAGSLSLQWCSRLAPPGKGRLALWLFSPWRGNSLLSEPLRSLGHILTPYTGWAPH